MKEKLQLTPQKYKALPEATMKNYMLLKWTTREKLMKS